MEIDSECRINERGGFRPTTTKVDHKTRKFGGGLNPFIHPPFF